VFTTDVELDIAAQDTYVPFTKKIVAAYRKIWKTAEKIKLEQIDRIWR
jgi:fructosamine-3-kinase